MIHLSSLVRTRSNMATLLCLESNETQVVTRLLTCDLCGVPTCCTRVHIYVVQVKSNCFIRNLKRSASLSHDWFLSFCVAAFRVSSFRTCLRPLMCSSQKTRSPEVNIWNKSLGVPSHAALSPNIWYIQRLKLINQTPPNELLLHRYVFSPLLGLRLNAHEKWRHFIPTWGTYLRLSDHFFPRDVKKSPRTFGVTLYKEACYNLKIQHP